MTVVSLSLMPEIFSSIAKVRRKHFRTCEKVVRLSVSPEAVTLVLAFYSKVGRVCGAYKADFHMKE